MRILVLEIPLVTQFQTQDGLELQEDGLKMNLKLYLKTVQIVSMYFIKKILLLQMMANAFQKTLLEKKIINL